MNVIPRTAVLALLVCLPLAASARAEVPPLSDADLLAEATHVVVGRIEGHYRMERSSGAGHADSAVVTEVAVSAVEKGSGPTAGRVLYARWWRAAKRPEGWAGPGGMTVDLPVGATARLFLARGEDGAYDLLRPNGATVLEGVPSTGGPKPPAAETPLAETAESLRFEVARLLDTARRDRAKAQAALADWLLPDARAWFGSVFGSDHGPRGADEYAQTTNAEALPVLVEFLAGVAETLPKEPLEVAPLEAKDSDSWQGRLTSRMSKPTRLWTVRAGGKPLRFFVFVDGRWRVTGRMRAISER